MNQPPLNPDAIRELTEAIRLTVEYVGTGMLPAIPGWSWYDAMVKYAPNDAEVLRAMDPLPEPAAALPEVTSVEQWDALPIGTMVRVHFNGNSELIIRCPAGSGAGIGGMSFLGGRHWSDVFTVWNADKLEIKYIPEVNDA